MYAKLAGLFPAMLLALLVYCTPSKADVLEQCPGEFNISDKELADLLKYSSRPRLPDGRYMTINDVREHMSLYSHLYELNYQFRSGETGFCTVFEGYLNQIRILDTCPEGTKDNGMPCIEIIPDGEGVMGMDIDPDGQCSANFLVYAMDESGYYNKEVTDYYIKHFPCGDLDKLPEQGRIPPGRLLKRNFVDTKLEKIYHPGYKMNIWTFRREY